MRNDFDEGREFRVEVTLRNGVAQAGRDGGPSGLPVPVDCPWECVIKFIKGR